MKPAASFWLTNISNRNVSLADLNLTIKAYTSVNLMDKKHYQYDPEQLKKSCQSGSIHKKRHCIKVRKVAPVTETQSMAWDQSAVIPTRQRSILDIKEEHYEELVITDEQFAEEMTENTQTTTRGDSK
jgi:hypothetical protein